MTRSNTRAQLRRDRRWRAVILAACWLAIGFSVGIIVTLKAVGFT